MISAADDFTLMNQSFDDILHDDDAETHFHEAGHAVAASILGVSFHLVTIEHQDDRGSNGRMEFHRGLEEYTWVRDGRYDDFATPLNACMMLVAGMAAQLRRQGTEADLQSCAVGDREKLETVSELTAEEIGLADSGRGIQQWAWREACLMMANPRVWRAVHALAMHLLEHETATESEVAEIVAAERVRYRPKRFQAAFIREETALE